MDPIYDRVVCWFEIDPTLCGRLDSWRRAALAPWPCAFCPPRSPTRRRHARQGSVRGRNASAMVAFWRGKGLCCECALAAKPLDPRRGARRWGCRTAWRMRDLGRKPGPSCASPGTRHGRFSELKEQPPRVNRLDDLGGLLCFAGCAKIIVCEPQPTASFGLRSSPGRTASRQASATACTCGYMCYSL